MIGRILVGGSVKARFQRGDQWYAGNIEALNRDGTYVVHYEDGDVETSVDRDMIEVKFVCELFRLWVICMLVRTSLTKES